VEFADRWWQGGTLLCGVCRCQMCSYSLGGIARSVSEPLGA